MSSIIDVSYNNCYKTPINWAKVAATGVTDVIVRLSLGYADIDKTAIANAKGAAAAGLAVSYYHFAYPDTKTGGTLQSDAENEATWFFNSIANNHLPDPKWLAADFETWDVTAGKDSPLNPADYLLWMQYFYNKINTLSGLPCMVYASAGYLNAHLPAGHNLGNNPLWVANYTDKPSPAIPHGWDTWFLWQYGDAPVDGVTDNHCDQNRPNPAAGA